MCLQDVKAASKLDHHLPTRESESAPEHWTLASSRHCCPHRQMVHFLIIARCEDTSSHKDVDGFVPPCMEFLAHAAWAHCAEPNPSPVWKSMAWIWPAPFRPVAWKLNSTTITSLPTNTTLTSLPGDCHVQQSNTETLQTNRCGEKKQQHHNLTSIAAISPEVIFLKRQKFLIILSHFRFGRRMRVCGQGDRGWKDNLDCKSGLVKGFWPCTGQHCGQLHMTKVFPNTAYCYCNTPMSNKLGRSWENGAGAGTLQSQPVWNKGVSRAQDFSVLHWSGLCVVGKMHPEGQELIWGMGCRISWNYVSQMITYSLQTLAQKLRNFWTD